MTYPFNCIIFDYVKRLKKLCVMYYKVIYRKTNEIAAEYVSFEEAMTWCSSMYYFERM